MPNLLIFSEACSCCLLKYLFYKGVLAPKSGDALISGEAPKPGDAFKPGEAAPLQADIISNFAYELLICLYIFLSCLVTIYGFFFKHTRDRGDCDPAKGDSAKDDPAKCNPAKGDANFSYDTGNSVFD